MRTGQVMISSLDEGDPHTHRIDGEETSADAGEGHFHTVTMKNGIELTSGPPISQEELGVVSDGITKGLLPELIDPNHTYVFRTGQYGIYDYWYIDRAGNYWKYTNAPEDDEHHDELSGVAVLVPDQPMPHTAPGFFTVEGRKRHMAVPEGMVPERNETYDPLDPKNLWYEIYRGDNSAARYVYLDADVRENLDLWVQYQLRVVAATLSKFRKYAANLFEQNHPKDRIIGAVLMLCDQALYSPEELVEAAVGDLEFIEDTVKLLGRKFTCDPVMLDFLTSLKGARDASSPLFELETYHGKSPIGKHLIWSIFKQLKVSPYYLLGWHASHSFSKILHRLASEEIDPDQVEALAFAELKQVFNTKEDVRHLVDYKVRETLLQNYEDSVVKSVKRVSTDDFGVRQVYSDLSFLTDPEVEFAEWLHAEPMHVITPEEEAEIESQLAEQAVEEGGDEDTGEASPDKTEALGGGGTAPANPTPEA